MNTIQNGIQKSSSGKDRAISAVRLIATCMIVAFHFVQHYTGRQLFWLNVGVQIFLVISGYLYGKRVYNREFRWLRWIVKSFKKILLDYYIYIIPMLILYWIYSPSMLSSEKVIGALLGARIVIGMGHFWFISYILFCYLLTPLLNGIWERYCKSRWKIAVVYVVTVFFTHWLLKYYGNYFDGAWISCYTTGFFLGRLVRENEKRLLTAVRIVFPVLAVLMNGVKLWIDGNQMQPQEGIGQLLYQTYTDYAYAVLGIGMFLVFYEILSRLLKPDVKKKKVDILAISDKYSYDVYITHMFLVMGTSKFIDYFSSKWIAVPFVLCLVALCTVVLHGVRTFLVRKIPALT